MITRKNQLTVPEVSCHSLQEVEGGYVIRYLVRNPEEVEWRAVKVFRPTEHDQELASNLETRSAK